jgi:hypothetical protein
MKIGIDGIPLSAAKTGVGHYTFEVARALAVAQPQEEFQVVSQIPFVAAAIESTVANTRQSCLRPSTCKRRHKALVGSWSSALHTPQLIRPLSWHKLRRTDVGRRANGSYHSRSFIVFICGDT